MSYCIYLHLFDNEEYCDLNRDICENCKYRYTQEDYDFDMADMERNDID